MVGKNERKDSSTSDFLWGTGNAPAGAAGGVTDQTGLPAWYQEYLRGSINKSSSLAGAPYTQYSAPRVAGFNADTTNSFANTRANTGSWRPGMDTASSLTQAGSTYNPNTFQQNFINPYTSGVMDDITRRSNNNFNEKVMPGVMDTFTGGGQFGSARNGRIMDQATRDQQDTLTGQLATAGQNAWDSGQRAYSDWGTKSLQGGTQTGNIASAIQTAGLKDAGALDTIGRSQQQQTQSNLDTAYSDFQNQQNYGKDQAGWLAGIIRGYNPPPSTQTQIPTGTSLVQGQSPLVALTGGLGAAIAGTQPQVQNRKSGGLITLKKRVNNGSRISKP